MQKMLTIAGVAALLMGVVLLLLRILPSRLFMHRVEGLFGLGLLIVASS